jgi:hypothetical protein
MASMIVREPAMARTVSPAPAELDAVEAVLGWFITLLTSSVICIIFRAS